MNKLIITIIALVIMSLNVQAEFDERAQLRNELNLALDISELNEEASSAGNLWSLDTMWIDIASYVSFKVPGLEGLKVTPTVRVVMRRN